MYCSAKRVLSRIHTNEEKNEKCRKTAAPWRRWRPAWGLVGLAAMAVKQRQEDTWERTLERVSQGVVVIRVCSVMAFDMNDASFSTATGFVVDRTLGSS